MPSVSTNLALKYGWAPTEGGWGNDMDANLLMMDAVVQLSVSANGAVTPPPSPASGLKVIVGSGASGAFAGQDGRIAVYNGTAWSFFTPRNGWLAYLMTAADEKLLRYKNGTWAPALTQPVASVAYVPGTDLTMNGAKVQKPRLEGYTERVLTAAVAAGKVSLDMSQANVFDVVLTANTQLEFAGVATPADSAISATVKLTQGGAGGFAVTWPLGVKWSNKTVPKLTTAAGSVSVLTFMSYDGGATWFGGVLVDNA